MKAKKRKTKGGEGYIYYTLCGSWRDSQGLSMRDELLHLGRHEDFDVWEMREVADIVTGRANGEPQSAFYEQEHSQKVRTMADIMDTQHSVATEMKNLHGDTIHIENPTEPTEQVREICEKVGISPVPYKTKKSVGVQISKRKNEGKENQGVIEPDISNTG